MLGLGRCEYQEYVYCINGPEYVTDALWSLQNALGCGEWAAVLH